MSVQLMTSMPELVLQKILEVGIYDLQNNPDRLDVIFAQYKSPEFNAIYGQKYIDSLKKWFVDTEIPVVQSWSFNPDRIPAISVHLSTENEDLSKAALGDYMGEEDEIGDGVDNVHISVFLIKLDIGVHASKQGNYVMWLYYIIQHIILSSISE